MTTNPERSGDYHVYLVRCADGTYYTGMTRDLGRRIDEHNRGEGARYTRGRAPVELAASRGGLSRSAAARLERAWKALSKEEKAALGGDTSSGPVRTETAGKAGGASDGGADHPAGGCLYLCGTPIGNLDDLTRRVLQVLASVDYVAAEDTRRTRALLSHEGISKPMVSYHEHNKRTRGPVIIDDLKRGKKVALVTDAGMPGISDPGEDLVREAVAEGLAVVPIPGPSAMLAALVASGLPATPFAFNGFLPRTSRERRAAFLRLADSPWTTVFYEAPHRLAATLKDLQAALGSRPVVVARELTKRHESFHRGTAVEVLAEIERLFPSGGIKGEACLIVAGSSLGGGEGKDPSGKGAGPGTEEKPTDLSSPTIWRLVREEETRGTGRKEAMKNVAVRLGLSRRQVYQAVLEAKDGPAGANSTGPRQKGDRNRS
ncbi:MAG: 16S rRNA (cytidine(1402)-2'-O)-methyltransferase [Bacillota bacterium]